MYIPIIYMFLKTISCQVEDFVEIRLSKPYMVPHAAFQCFAEEMAKFGEGEGRAAVGAALRCLDILSLAER